MTAGGDPLPCGTALDDLARQVFDREPAADPAHQTGCADCQAALLRVTAIRDDVRGLASQRVEPPPGLVRQVMARLRVAPALVTIDVSARGRTQVAESVVARLARRAALAVEDVVLASALTTETAEGTTVGLRVRLAVAYGPALHSVADQVRERIRADVVAQTGVTVEEVRVSVDDLA